MLYTYVVPINRIKAAGALGLALASSAQAAPFTVDDINDLLSVFSPDAGKVVRSTWRTAEREVRKARRNVWRADRERADKIFAFYREAYPDLKVARYRVFLFDGERESSVPKSVRRGVVEYSDGVRLMPVVPLSVYDGSRHSVQFLRPNNIMIANDSVPLFYDSSSRTLWVHRFLVSSDAATNRAMRAGRLDKPLEPEPTKEGDERDADI